MSLENFESIAKREMSVLKSGFVYAAGLALATIIVIAALVLAI